MRQLGQPFQRPGKPGYWLRWTDPLTKKRILKGFHSKGFADHYRSILYVRLNSDVITGTIDIPLTEAVKEYLETYAARGLRPAARTEARLTLDKFLKLGGIARTRAITQKVVDRFVAARLDGQGSRWTVNKDVSNLRAFVRWAQVNRYIQEGIAFRKVKVAARIVKALSIDQVRALLAACPSMAWRVRILLALVTGLRKRDLDGLPAAALDLKRLTLDTTSQKTGKAYIDRPIPRSLKPTLTEYLRTIDGAGHLFADSNIRKTWDSIRSAAELPNITRQDFRRTFATLIQKAGSIGSARDLLEHADSRTTEGYTDTELILRWKVNRLPVREWLKTTPKKSKRDL